MDITKTDGDFDAVVTGASLAGCATATFLARRGLRVALVDKHAGPGAYKRLCGHYIQASATPVLQRLGLAERIEDAGGVRNGVDVWTRWGIVGRHDPGRSRFGYSIRRSKLDPLIRDMAANTPGVEYMPAQEVIELTWEGGRVSGVELRDRAGAHAHLTARAVIGADGRNSAVARLAGARERRSGNERFCYLAYFTGVEVPNRTGGRFWALDPDVAIASANDEDHTVLAAFVHKRRRPEFEGDKAAALLRFFQSLPEGPGLEHAEPAGKAVGYKDYGIVARDPNPAPGLALVGDAALTCDPVMAIGCGWALQSAQWLADELGPSLAAGEAPDAALRAYRRIHRRQLRPHHRMLSMDAKARRMNPVQRMLFAAATKDPSTAQTFHRYAERSIPPSALLGPRALARAAWVCAGGRA